jgi:hypothetical protein
MDHLGLIVFLGVVHTTVPSDGTEYGTKHKSAAAKSVEVFIYHIADRLLFALQYLGDSVFATHDSIKQTLALIALREWSI